MFRSPAVLATVLTLLFLGATVPAPAALIAEYSHENPVNRLQDDTGGGHALEQFPSSPDVEFIAAPPQPNFHHFRLGDTVAYYASRDNDRYLQVPDAVYPKDPGDGGGDFTFTGLAYASSGGGWRTILSSDRFRFTMRAGSTGVERLHLGVWNEAGTGLSSADSPVGTLAPETWYFWALRFDQAANTVQGFLQEASDTWDPVVVSRSGSAVPPSFNELTDLALGKNLKAVANVSGTDPFAGMMDNVRVHTTALSDAELESAFFQFSVPEPGTFLLLVLGLCGLLLRRNRLR